MLHPYTFTSCPGGCGSYQCPRRVGCPHLLSVAGAILGVFVSVVREVGISPPASCDKIRANKMCKGRTSDGRIIVKTPHWCQKPLHTQTLWGAPSLQVAVRILLFVRTAEGDAEDEGHEGEIEVLDDEVPEDTTFTSAVPAPDFEAAAREAAAVDHCVKKVFGHEAFVLPCRSLVQGVHLDGSDVDLCLDWRCRAEALESSVSVLEVRFEVDSVF